MIYSYIQFLIHDKFKDAINPAEAAKDYVNHLTNWELLEELDFYAFFDLYGEEDLEND